MGGKVVYLFLFALMIYGRCDAKEAHKVGESFGWSNINLVPSYYKSWTASKVFHVGDTILFEYNKEFHNVVRVTHKNFNACNATAPYATWATGNDSFTIARPGHYYFICGFPAHCWAGQKVDVRVLLTSGPSPSPSPHSQGLTPRGPPEAGPPLVDSDPPAVSASPTHPPKRSASSSLHSCLKLWLCVICLGLASVAF